MTKEAQALHTMRVVMQKLGHLTYRGDVYFRHPKAKETYIPLCDVDCYVDTLLRNKGVMPIIITYKAKLKEMLNSDNGVVAEEVIFDYDLIEVRRITPCLFHYGNVLNTFASLNTYCCRSQQFLPSTSVAVFILHYYLLLIFTTPHNVNSFSHALHTIPVSTSTTL